MTQDDNKIEKRMKNRRQQDRDYGRESGRRQGYMSIRIEQSSTAYKSRRDRETMQRADGNGMTKNKGEPHGGQQIGRDPTVYKSRRDRESTQGEQRGTQ